MRALFPLALPFLLSCMSYNVQPIGDFDATQRTMTVAQGGGGLTGTLKAKLRAAGWKLAVDRGPRVSETESTSASSRTEEFDSFNTRYRMAVGAHWVDMSLGGEGIYTYDISIVDNKSGEEVLTMNGRGIESTIAEELLKAIRKQTR